MNGKGHSDEVSDGGKECVIRQWRKGNPCYKAAKNLAELCLCSSVFSKTELASNALDF